MQLTTAQTATLKAWCEANYPSAPLTVDGSAPIAEALNTVATPDYWVWRSEVSENEITRTVSDGGGVWSWPAFIARSPGEQAGWARIFNGTYTCNPALTNVRQGFSDIFSGAQNSAPAQRAHLLAISRRQATVLEQLFAGASAAPPTPSGNLGTATNVATMTVEGTITAVDLWYVRTS